MKLLLPVLVGVAVVSACSTASVPIQPAANTVPGDAPQDTAWIERNGPSPVPREGWVQTVSGWYASRDACLHQPSRDIVGTPLSVAEECLEPGR